MKMITQEDVDKAWEDWKKARDKDWEAREKARKDWRKAQDEAWKLERKFGEQEDLK